MRIKLGHDIGRGAEGLIVEHSQIFFDRLGRSLLAATPSRPRSLPIGIRLDQTGIDRKRLPADQPLADAALQNRFEDTLQQIAVAKRPCRFFEKVE